MRVTNAIILAAGTSSRFAPLSYEKPKALIEVKGEILIERQIKQLQDAGINDIIIVTGYKSEQFNYLIDKFNVKIIYNPEYKNRNNNASIYIVKDYLKNSYICSSDNYFIVNPFKKEVDESFYSAIYIKGKTKEWCIEENDGWIKNVKIGGNDSWVMLGHVFWSEEFSKKFIKILDKIYNKPETKDKLWESIFIENLEELPMKIQKYESDFIFEFDSLDELRKFDSSYINNTRSSILKEIVKKINCEEKDIKNINVIKENNICIGFSFETNIKYNYYYDTKKLEVKNV